jgi:hypothetical protein
MTAEGRNVISLNSVPRRIAGKANLINSLSVLIIEEIFYHQYVGGNPALMFDGTSSYHIRSVLVSGPTVRRRRGL